MSSFHSQAPLSLSYLHEAQYPKRGSQEHLERRLKGVKAGKQSDFSARDAPFAVIYRFHINWSETSGLWTS